MSQQFDNNVLDLAKQKGFCLYVDMTDFEKFKEELPCKEKLTIEKLVTKNMNLFLNNIYNKFEMKTVKDYYDLYLKCDVLSLADLFEKFRNNSLKNYGLCPSHYLSAPGVSWDAILKMTKGKLELIPDPDMYIFFEKGT